LVVTHIIIIFKYYKKTNSHGTSPHTLTNHIHKSQHKDSFFKNKNKQPCKNHVFF